MNEQQRAVCEAEERETSYDAALVQQLAERHYIRQMTDKQRKEET